MPARPDRKREHRQRIAALTLLAAFVVIGVGQGWPLPAADDLMFTGASLSLAAGHGLQNPLLENQFGPGPFLVYPPFHFYLQAGWLWVFGVSAEALTAFELVAYAVFGISTAVLLEQRGLLPKCHWPWPLLFAIGGLATLGTMGLRPEADGFAALFAGLALRERAQAPAKAIGWLLIGAAPGIAPHTVTFAVAALLGTLVFDPTERAKIWCEWPWVIGAAGALVALLYGAVDGDVEALIAGIRHHAERTSLPVAAATSVVWTHVRHDLAIHLPWILAGVATIALMCFSRRDPVGRAKWAGAFGALAAAAVVSMRLDVSRTEIWSFVAVVWCLAAAAALFAQGRRVAAASALLVLTLGMAWTGRGALTGAVAAPELRPEDVAELRTLAGETSGDILVDSWSARYIFDYRPPAGARDWTFGRRFPQMWPTGLSAIAPDETWMIAGRNLRLIAPERAGPLVSAFSIFGQSLGFRPSDHRIVVIAGGGASSLATLPESARSSHGH